MIIKKISDQDYRKFIAETCCHYYFQSSPAGVEYSRKLGHEVELVGFYSQTKLLAVAKLLFFRVKKFFRRGTLAYGPIGLAEDAKTYSAAAQALKDYLGRRSRLLEFDWTPLARAGEYEDIKLLGDRQKGMELERALEAEGFKRLEGTFIDRPEIQPQYLYSKDISGMSYREMLQSCAYDVRSALRRNSKYAVRTRFLKPSEIEIFNRLMQQSIIDNQIPEHTAILADQVTASLADTSIRYIVAYIDRLESLENNQSEQESLEEELNRVKQIQTKKALNRQAELEAELQRSRKRKLELESLFADGSQVKYLAVGQYYLSPIELTYAQAATTDGYISAVPGYSIHERAFELAESLGVREYNMFAVSGLGPEAPDSGVLAYKQKFRGRIIEHIGTYRLQFRPRLSKLLEI